MDFNKVSVHKTPENSPGFLLWRVSTLWRRSIEEVLKPLDLTHPQFVILATTAWLTRSQASTNQIMIARQAGLDPNTTSQVLRGLQAKGLIERKHTTDERSKQPTLTKLGRDSLTRALPVVETADSEFFSSLNSEMKHFLAHLQTLNLIAT